MSARLGLLMGCLLACGAPVVSGATLVPETTRCGPTILTKRSLEKELPTRTFGGIGYTGRAAL